MFCLLYCSIIVTVRVLNKYLYSIYVLFTLNDFIHSLSFCFYVALFSYSFLFSSLGYNGGISFVRIQSGKIFILFPTQENWYAFSVIRFIFSTYFHLDYFIYNLEMSAGKEIRVATLNMWCLPQPWPIGSKVRLLYYFLV